MSNLFPRADRPLPRTIVGLQNFNDRLAQGNVFWPLVIAICDHCETGQAFYVEPMRDITTLCHSAGNLCRTCHRPFVHLIDPEHPRELTA